MEEKFVLNEVDQRQGLWGRKWEAGLSSSSLQSNEPPYFSSHTPLLLSFSFPVSSLNSFLSHDCICVFIYPMLTPTHTFWATYYCCSFSFESFDFFPASHCQQVQKVMKQVMYKVFSYNKGKQKAFTYVRQNSFQDLKY